MNRFLIFSFALTLGIAQASVHCPEPIESKRLDCDSFDLVSREFIYGGSTSVILDESRETGKIVSVVLAPPFEDRFETSLKKTKKGYEGEDGIHVFSPIDATSGNLTIKTRTGKTRIYQCQVQE